MEFIVEEDGKRLDVFLKEKLSVSRSEIKNSIDNGLILVDNQVVKAGLKLKTGMVITGSLLEKKELSASPENISLDIVYEDDDLLVINKPQGMVVHPAVGNYSGTLVNALKFHINSLSSVNGDFRPGIVHRLDKNTSGLLIVAKNNRAHENLAQQIKTKTCKRHYMAVLEGKLKEDSGKIETYISRSKKNRTLMEVCFNPGKIAITNFDVVERLNGYTLTHFELKTGRTHQIRVHCKYMGHPVVGDEVYGFKGKHKGLNGQLLHAYKLVFLQPTTKKRIVLEIPLPDYFVNFVEKNRF